MTCQAAHVRAVPPSGGAIRPRPAGCTCPIEQGPLPPGSRLHQGRRIDLAEMPGRGITLAELAPPLSPGHMGRALDGDDPPVAWAI